jgi:hypothetical protein
MLSDLLILELYYDHPACAFFFEDMTRQYGVETVRKALRAGNIIARPIVVGPDSGRILLGLTDKGRQAAG